MKNINKNCDCHFHVFGPSARYPYSQGRSYTPTDASLGDFFNLLGKNDIGRAVIIQPSVYNFDNSATIEALKAKPSELRGIVVIEDTHDFEELKEWNEYGVRGVRVNLLFNSGINASHVRKLAKLIKPLGWHLQLLIDVSTYDNLYEEFKDIYMYAYDKGLKGCTTFRFNPEAFQGVLVKESDLENTTYEFTLDDGTTVSVKGNEEIEYDGEIHSAANLFDALKEGTYGKY